MPKSINKVILIGNLSRDPELRYTPQGTAVCTMGLATNSSWTTDGQKHEEVEYHRLVAWSKLAEICSQYLTKGSKIYIEGKLKTRKWTGQDGHENYTTEIIMNDMVMLTNKGAGSQTAPAAEAAEPTPPPPTTSGTENVDPNDIPF